MLANLRTGDALRSQLFQPWCAGALSQLAAVGSIEKPVVVIDRLWQIEQNLKQAVQVGGGVEIGATGDVGDALAGVVDDNREVIACGRVLADLDRIAPSVRIGRNNPL